MIIKKNVSAKLIEVCYEGFTIDDLKYKINLFILKCYFFVKFKMLKGIKKIHCNTKELRKI